MSNISTASKIAIAFIRPFRAYLDGYALVKDKRSSIEDNFKKRMDDVVGNLRDAGYKVEDNEISIHKNLFFKLSVYMLDKYEKSYDTVLPHFIDTLTINIENKLKEVFSENELEELLMLVNNPVFMKLLGEKHIFALLKDCEVQMDQEIQFQIMESMLDMNNTNISKIVDEFKNKFKYDDQNDDFFNSEHDNDFWDDDDRK